MIFTVNILELENMRQQEALLITRDLSIGK